MAAVDLLDRLTDAGLTAVVDGDRLIVRPREQLTDNLRAAIREHRAELMSVLPSYRWHIVLQDGHELEIGCVPELTAAEVMARYPSAWTIAPIASITRRQPNAAETAELSELIATVYRNETEEERAEALTLALADPASALLCYRAIARARDGDHRA